MDFPDIIELEGTKLEAKDKPFVYRSVMLAWAIRTPLDELTTFLKNENFLKPIETNAGHASVCTEFQPIVMGRKLLLFDIMIANDLYRIQITSDREIDDEKKFSAYYAKGSKFVDASSLGYKMFSMFIALLNDESLRTKFSDLKFNNARGMLNFEGKVVYKKGSGEAGFHCFDINYNELHKTTDLFFTLSGTVLHLPLIKTSDAAPALPIGKMAPENFKKLYPSSLVDTKVLMGVLKEAAKSGHGDEEVTKALVLLDLSD